MFKFAVVKLELCAKRDPKRSLPPAGQTPAEAQNGKPSTRNVLLFRSPWPKVKRMMEPLALIVYENLLPATQIVNRLQDLKYRVQTMAQAEELVRRAQELRPMLVIADLSMNRERVLSAVKLLRKEPATQHLPVIAFCRDEDARALNAIAPEGITMLVGATAVLNHLPQLLEQALQVE